MDMCISLRIDVADADADADYYANTAFYEAHITTPDDNPRKIPNLPAATCSTLSFPLLEQQLLQESSILGLFPYMGSATTHNASHIAQIATSLPASQNLDIFCKF
jgi:hypothetical protein